MRTRNPEEHEDEDAPDTCPVCAKYLNDDGECDEHGGVTEWKQLSAESRASFRSAPYEDR